MRIERRKVVVNFKPFSGGTKKPETKFIRGAANTKTIDSNTEGLHSSMPVSYTHLRAHET